MGRSDNLWSLGYFRALEAGQMTHRIRFDEVIMPACSQFRVTLGTARKPISTLISTAHSNDQRGS